MVVASTASPAKVPATNPASPAKAASSQTAAKAVAATSTASPAKVASSQQAATPEQMAEEKQKAATPEQMAETKQELRNRLAKVIVDEKALRGKVAARFGESMVLSLLAALCMVMVAVWLAMSMYDVFRAVLLPRTRHAEHHLFVEWLSTTCTRPHLRESLICQVAHMDARGLQPENWLVRQLALIKVRERGIDFCPNESAAQGLTGIVEQHLKNIWVRAGLKMAGLLTLDAEATLKKMANGEIGLSRLDDELGALRQRQGERLVKKLLRDPLKAWGIVLADLKPPRLRCGGGGEGEEARTTLRAASVIAAIAALLGGIELMMRDRARQGQGPVTAPARLLDAAAKAVKKAFNAAVQKVATGLVQARAWLLEPESWRARLLNKASQVAAVVAEKGETLLLVIYQRANPGKDRPGGLQSHWRGILGCGFVLVGFALLLVASAPWLVPSEQAGELDAYEYDGDDFYD